MANTALEFQKDRYIFTLSTFELSARKKFLVNDFLSFNTGVIFFICLENNREYDSYIQNNFSAIKACFENKKRVFVYKPIVQTINSLTLKYFFPFLKPKVQNNFSLSIDDQALLEYVNYDGGVKTGFLSFHSQGISFMGIKPNESIKEYVSDYLRFLTIDKGRNIFYSLGEKRDKESNVELDEETKTILKKIESKLEILKESGHFFLIAPKVEQLLKKYIELDGKYAEFRMSTLYIDKEYGIFLPDFNNIEIKLAHLTKAIYILFLNHPNGIHLTDLKIHKKELFSIYRNISYKISLDKMEASVDELLTNKNAIFVHLSRIKSAFVKQFTDYYAKNYYIQGEKGKVKYIPLAKEQNNITAKITFEVNN